MSPRCPRYILAPATVLRNRTHPDPQIFLSLDLGCNPASADIDVDRMLERGFQRKDAKTQRRNDAKPPPTRLNRKDAKSAKIRMRKALPPTQRKRRGRREPQESGNSRSEARRSRRWPQIRPLALWPVAGRVRAPARAEPVFQSRGRTDPCPLPIPSADSLRSLRPCVSNGWAGGSASICVICGHCQGPFAPLRLCVFALRKRARDAFADIPLVRAWPLLATRSRKTR
jgi:hypothetical protein